MYGDSIWDVQEATRRRSRAAETRGVPTRPIHGHRRQAGGRRAGGPGATAVPLDGGRACVFAQHPEHTKRWLTCPLSWRLALGSLRFISIDSLFFKGKSLVGRF